MLPKSVIKEIRNEVDDVYDRIRSRFLGDKYKKKGIVFEVKNDTLDEFFKKILELEGGEYNKDVLDTLKDVCGSYLDASREKAKAQVINAIQAIIRESVLSGEVPNIRTAIEGQMTKVWGDASKHVETILNAEINTAKNVSILEGITEYNAKIGVDDPVVFFVIVRDGAVCSECIRLHMLPDGVTPRLWKMSDVGSGYHKKGENNPKIGGLHPHCRCQLTTLLPGYGFNAAGKVTYISKDHDEYAKQQGMAKSEELAKSTRETLTDGLWYGIQEYVKKHSVPTSNPITDEWRQKVANAALAVHVPADIFGFLIREGRLQNQFESKTSMGLFDHRIRKRAEEHLFGIPIPKSGRHRPIYGALHINNERAYGPAPAYGNVWLELHPHVKERSTFTPSDSLNHWNAHGENSKKIVYRFPDLTKGISRNDVDGYLEAQIHGGVYLKDDVKAIHIQAKHFDQGDRELKKIYDTARKYNVPVHMHWEGGTTDVGLGHPMEEDDED
jgi:uncharacterized protein YqgV (UPF0045/DUF77 family)